MRIGALRPEEAKAFDSRAGQHEISGISVEVFWADGDRPGWYWWICLPLHDHSDAYGPFGSSIRAYYDAVEYFANDETVGAPDYANDPDANWGPANGERQ